MKTILKTTEDCKAYLASHFPQLPPKLWKRVRKYKHDNKWSYRTFVNGEVSVIVVTDSEDGFRKMKRQGVLDSEDQPIVDALIAAAKTIRHCGDYGDIFYNPANKQVWGCYGDADFCDDEHYTSYEDALRILKVPGVSSVKIEDECSPDNEDPDHPEDRAWVDLGRYGIEVCYDYKTETYSERQKT